MIQNVHWKGQEFSRDPKAAEITGEIIKCPLSFIPLTPRGVHCISLESMWSNLIFHFNELCRIQIQSESPSCSTISSI